MNDKLAQMMAKVQRLLAQADNVEAKGQSLSGQVNESDNANEAAAFRAAAERIMREYRIEEEQLIAVDQFATVPTMHTFLAHAEWSEFNNSYYMMMYAIAQHCGVEMVRRYHRPQDGEDNGLWFDLFGYEGDLRAATWLWSSARLVFGGHLEPSVDPVNGDQVNAYLLRRSGMLRKDIARKLWGENTPANRSRAQRLYVKECEARGEHPSLTGLGSDAETYRDAYADSFVSRLSERLRRSRDAADSTGGAITLVGRAERVKEAKYAAYPNLRPKPRTEVEVVATTPAPPAKVDRRRKAWTQADERAYQRRNNASAAAGRAAGSAAASKVEMTPRDHTPAQRVNPVPSKAIEL